MQIDNGKALVPCSVCNGLGEVQGETPLLVKHRGRRRAKKLVALPNNWHVCPACDGVGKVWRIIRVEGAGDGN